jgi:oxygen-independent coproporphyrinogen-3 oxidase
VDDPAAYVAAVRASGAAEEWAERPSPAAALLESLMMGLRLVDEGVDLAALAASHGIDPRVVHADAIARHVEAELLSRRGDRLVATDRGLDVLNAVLVDFVPEDASTAEPPGAYLARKRPST